MVFVFCPSQEVRRRTFSLHFAVLGFEPCLLRTGVRVAQQQQWGYHSVISRRKAVSLCPYLTILIEMDSEDEDDFGDGRIREVGGSVEVEDEKRTGWCNTASKVEQGRRSGAAQRSGM